MKRKVFFGFLGLYGALRTMQNAQNSDHCGPKRSTGLEKRDFEKALHWAILPILFRDNMEYICLNIERAEIPTRLSAFTNR